jgi:hypothetical protein
MRRGMRNGRCANCAVGCLSKALGNALRHDHGVGSRLAESAALTIAATTAPTSMSPTA